MLKKFCPYRGCKELIPISQTYCDKHNSYTDYDKDIRHGRDKKYYDFYHNDKQWQTVRMQAIVRDHGLCIECLKDSHIVTYHVVHHLKAIKTAEGWRHRYDLNGLECVCEKHHQQLEREAK